MVPTMHEQNNYLQQNTFRRLTMHEQIIICGQLFVGHVVGSRPMERKKTMHQKIVEIVLYVHLFQNIGWVKILLYRTALWATNG